MRKYLINLNNILESIFSMKTYYIYFIDIAYAKEDLDD